MEDIGATSFTLAEAVVELVANSIDARPHEESGSPMHLAIDIGVDSNQVSVVDDGVGMTEEILVQAVRLGVKMDRIQGHRKRKGMYGLGLKTAAASIGRYWSVLTRPIDGESDYFLEFDLAMFSKARTNALQDWAVEVETRERTEDSLLGARKSGTVVVIKQLRDKMPMAGSVTQLLGDAYEPHLVAGDKINVNGSPAQPREYNFVADSRQEFDEKIGSGGQWRIRGWVALDSKTHNDGAYGFNLYRENQLIETWDKSWFRAHLMTSRIIGVAHIDFVPANFNKQGFITQSEEWLLTKEHMSKFLKPVTRASQEANRGRGDASKLKRAVQGMKKALGGIRPIGDVFESDEEANRDNDPSPEKEPQTEMVTDEKIIIKGHEVIPSYIVADWESDTTPWDYTYEDFDNGKRTDVQAVLNSASLLYETTSDTATLGIIAVADCITRYLVERRDLEPSQAREIRDRWIHAALVSKKMNIKNNGMEENEPKL